MHGLLVVPHRSLFCGLLAALDLVMGDSRLDRSLLLCLQTISCLVADRGVCDM